MAVKKGTAQQPQHLLKEGISWINKKSLRGVCVFWCSHNCPDCPLNSEVWIAFFALSCLSTSLPVGAISNNQPIRELHNWIKGLEHKLDGCDVMLYSPHNNDINEPCIEMVMQCFLLEMEVIMFEMDINDSDEIILLSKNDTLIRQLPQSRCKLCELHEKTNSREFLQRFKDFLEMVFNRNYS